MDSYPELSIAYYLYLSFVALLLISCIIIAKDKVINICRKNKEDKLKNKLSYDVKNFIRYCNSRSKNKYTIPSEIKKLYSISLANKFCIISIDFAEKELIYYDKATDKAFIVNKEILFETSLEDLFNKLCKKFNFETKIEDIVVIMSSVFFNVKKYVIELEDYRQEKQMIKNITINNLSIAELITLPGINIGKANKIKKRLQYKSFRRLQDFINFAQISEEDAQEIQEIFNNDIRYIPKK